MGNWIKLIYVIISIIFIAGAMGYTTYKSYYLEDVCNKAGYNYHKDTYPNIGQVEEGFVKCCKDIYVDHLLNRTECEAIFLK